MWVDYDGGNTQEFYALLLKEGKKKLNVQIHASSVRDESSFRMCVAFSSILPVSTGALLRSWLS